MPKISLDKFKWAAEHAFWVFLILVFLALLLGGYMFYKYYILAKRVEPEIKEASLQFKEDLYQTILSEWQEREIRFREAETKEYPDPF
ncbi:MAG: hypothetical protein DRZ76_01190 [Candidatus Nealsonbacteria bacterium]|nr:MAG: hypothetical protein DRZ76_01190 [Candidatus Nealsonbacteria bacterium]